MSDTLSIAELAERVARANAQGQSGADYWLRVFRNLHTAGLLPAAEYRGHGRTAAALYDVDGLCLAAIAAALTRVARLEPQAMREVLPLVIAAGLPENAPARPFSGGRLADAVRGVLKGEAWELVVTLVDDAPKARFAARFRRASEIEPPADPVIEESFRATVRVVGRINMSLNEILAPYRLREGA